VSSWHLNALFPYPDAAAARAFVYLIILR